MATPTKANFESFISQAYLRNSLGAELPSEKLYWRKVKWSDTGKVLTVKGGGVELSLNLILN